MKDEGLVIPALSDGVLPEGVYRCTIEEVDATFGRFQRSDRRIRLTENLRRFVEDVRRVDVVAAVVINGSYVTAKAEPNDIDVVLALRPEVDLSQELRTFENNIQSKRMVRKLYGFDVRVALDGSELYQKHLDFFSQVRPDDPEQSAQRTHKGLLRIEL